MMVGGNVGVWADELAVAGEVEVGGAAGGVGLGIGMEGGGRLEIMIEEE